MRIKNGILGSYLFLLLVLLPCDWFYPTGHLFREAGAKPAIPWSAMGVVLIAVLNPRTLRSLGVPLYRAALLLFAIIFLGTLAFAANAICGWSGVGFAKGSATEFAAQASLFVLFSLVLLVHAQLFREERWRILVVSLLPWAVLMHLVVFSLEFIHVLNPGSGFLSLFRTTADIGRPSGLMSEPSYFGSFAGLYGGPLFLIRPARYYRWRAALAILLFACAVLIRAKTFVPVLLCELGVLLWRNPTSVLRFRNIPVAVAIAIVSFYVVIANAALDLQDNLSSIMRIGSAQLALNAALHGYALLGIGFGQFHFFYRPRFAPSYLFLSAEAAEQFSHSASLRASTYDFYIRLLLEEGVGSLLLFLGLVYSLLKRVRQEATSVAQFGTFLLAGSLGFLLTQDPYFYPPLMLSMAVLLGVLTDRSSRAGDIRGFQDVVAGW